MIVLDSNLWEPRKTDKKGTGIFLIKDVPAFSVIGDYLGRLTHNDSIIKSPSIPIYDFAYTDVLSVIPNDINLPGVHTINHSCAPNCVVKFYRHHILYIASRKLFAGEELTVDYALDPPESPNDKTILYPCFCGSIFCRGVMNLSQEDYDPDNAQLEELHGREGFNQYREAEQIRALPSYPKTLPLGSEYDVYASPKRYHTLHDVKLQRESELRKIMRETGCVLKYTVLGILVYGISDSMVILRMKGA